MTVAALPLAGLALGAVGTGVSVLGTLKAGQAQAASANYEAQVQRNNALIANQNASYATQAGQQHAEQQSLQQRALQGRIVAGQAANGIDPNTGSAVDVQQTARETGLTDVQQTVQNAALQNYGYRTQATSATASAGLSQLQAGQATQGAELGAFGALAGGAGQLGVQWQKMQTVGVGTGYGGISPENYTTE